MSRTKRNHPAVTDCKRWHRLRLKLMDAAGWRCVQCGKAGRLELDHVVPVQHGGDPWDPSNLQPLCRPCHFAKTAKENARPPSLERRAWMALLHR